MSSLCRLVLYCMLFCMKVSFINITVPVSMKTSQLILRNYVIIVFPHISKERAELSAPSKYAQYRFIMSSDKFSVLFLKRPCSYKFKHLLYRFFKGCIFGPEVNLLCISSHSSHQMPSQEPKWLIYSSRYKGS